MGSIHHLKNFIPNLAQLCTPRRLLLPTSNKFNFVWKGHHEKVFKKILNAVKNITDNRNFGGNRETHIICDASRDAIGAARTRDTRWFGNHCVCVAFLKFVRTKKLTKKTHGPQYGLFNFLSITSMVDVSL